MTTWLLPWTTYLFQNGSTLTKKFQNWPQSGKGDNNGNGRVASPESVAIHPKFFIPFLFKSLRRRGTACSIMTTGIYWVGGCFSGFYPSGRFNFCYIWRSCIWNRGSYMSGHYIWNDHENMILFIIWPFKIGFYCLQNDFYFNKKMHFWHGRCQCYVYAPKCYYTCGHTIFVTVLSTE